MYASFLKIERNEEVENDSMNNIENVMIILAYR